MNAFIHWLQLRGLNIDSLADVEEHLKNLREEFCPERYKTFIKNLHIKISWVSTKYSVNMITGHFFLSGIVLQK